MMDKESMQTEAANAAEMVCESCGAEYFYDQGRRCWSCDVMGCPACVEGAPEPMCPECRSRSLPEHLEPMLAKTGSLPSNSEAWAYEFKWDGVRALVFWDGRQLRLESRNLIDITARYPELADLGNAIGAPAILDGELVSLDKEGRPSFSMLQQRMHARPAEAARLSAKYRVYYYLFDLLYWDGHELLSVPFRERRRLLEAAGIAHPFCRVSPIHYGEGQVIVNVARQHGLEGVMCKRLESPYAPGLRSGDWRKVKFANSCELVVGGLRYEKRENRDRVGSLLAGAYDADMRLRFVGAVGTGFKEEDHRILLEYLEPLKTSQCPFEERVARPGVQYVQPKIVIETEYRRWPANGLIQQAAYKGVRIDRTAAEIRLEEQHGTG